MIIAVNFPISTSSPGLFPHPFFKGKALGTRLFQFKQLERRSLKKKIRASTGFEPVTSALPVRCSTNWAMNTLGARSIYRVHISREEWNDVKYIWNNSFLNCGCRWKKRPLLRSELKTSSKTRVCRASKVYEGGLYLAYDFALDVRLIHLFRPMIGPILICANRRSAVWKQKLYGHLNSPCLLSSASHKASKLLPQPAPSLAHFIFPFAILKSVPGFHNDTLFMRMGPNNRSLNRTAVVLPDGVRQDISRFAWWHTTLYNMVNIPFEMLF